ncbi:MAG: phosphohistidine phosphatase SixA [Myxococcales bacterium]|nr:phosphohistidine phosphatase SixA [Myxococcales bacterium]
MVRELFLMRHGVAADASAPGVEADAVRPLTAEGVSRTAAAARGLRSLGVRVDAIWSSPYVRTRQTAAVVAEELGVASVHVVDALASAATPPSVRIALLPPTEGSALLWVGHEPDLSDLLAELTAGGALRVAFKKAAVAHVLLHESPRRVLGELIAFYPPRALRALG